MKTNSIRLFVVFLSLLGTSAFAGQKLELGPNTFQQEGDHYLVHLSPGSIGFPTLGEAHAPYPINDRYFSILIQDCSSIFECQSKQPVEIVERHLPGNVDSAEFMLRYQVDQVPNAEGLITIQIQLVSNSGKEINVSKGFKSSDVHLIETP